MDESISLENRTQSSYDEETELTRLLAEMHRLNEQMRDDQAEIERLKVETRVISAHTDRLLLQIEAQLDALCKAA